MGEGTVISSVYAVLAVFSLINKSSAISRFDLPERMNCNTSCSSSRLVFNAEKPAALNRQIEATFPQKTDAAKRQIILPAAVIDLLLIHQKQLQKLGIISPWVFPNRYGDGLPPSTLTSARIHFWNRNGYRTSLHELRHTFVSINKNSMPEALLKHIVGHTRNTDTYEIYGHDVDGEFLSAQKIVNEVLKIFKNDVKTTVIKITKTLQLNQL